MLLTKEGNYKQGQTQLTAISSVSSSNFEIWSAAFPALATNLSQEAWEGTYAVADNFAQTTANLTDIWTCSLEDDLNNVGLPSFIIVRNVLWSWQQMGRCWDVRLRSPFTVL